MPTNKILLQRLKNQNANTYVGRPGEVTIDVAGDKLLKIHNGTTPGGVNLTVSAVATPATTTNLGSIKVGANLTITEDGTLNAENGDQAADRLVNGDLAVILNNKGTLATPLLLPVTFTAVLDSAHKTGAPLTLTGTPWEFTVQFQVNPNGTVETMMNSIFPNLVNPGYTTADQFSFTEADHGIPGYTFELELDNLVLAGPAGWTASPVVSIPPEYPATVQSLGAIKLVADEASWVFGTGGQLTVPGPIFRDGGLYMNSGGSTTAASVFVSGNSGGVILRTADNANNVSYDLVFDVNGETSFPGRLNFSDGSTLGDNILTGAVDSDLGLEIKRIVTVSGLAAVGSTTGTLIVDISADDDITVVLDGWEINAGTGIAPIWMPVTETTVDPGVTYEIVVPEFVFEPGNTYTFRNPTPESKTWFIRNQTGTLVAPGGAILSNETAPLGGGGTYRDFSIELPTPDGLNEKRWTFSNDGNLTLPDGESKIYSADPNISGGINGIGVVGKDRIYLTITNSNGSYQWDFRDYGLADYSTNRRPAIMFPGNSWIEEDLTNQSLNGGMFGPLLIGSQDKLTLRTNSLDLDNNGLTPLATYDWEFGKDGKLKLPVGGDIVDSNGNTVLGGGGGGSFTSLVNGSNTVSLDTNGNLQYPGGITQSRQDDTVCNAGVDTVVYTTTAQFQHAIKLFVMVEGMAPGGNGVNWDTQACDVIAVRGYANDIVHVTTYGVTYSSAAAFATFDGQWNATTSRIEITCRPVSPTNGVTVSVHAIEMNSND